MSFTVAFSCICIIFPSYLAPLLPTLLPALILFNPWWSEWEISTPYPSATGLEPLVPTGWRYLKEVTELLGGVESCWRKYVMGEGRLWVLCPCPHFQFTLLPGWWNVIFSCLLQLPAAMPSLPQWILPLEPKPQGTLFLTLFLVIVLSIAAGKWLTWVFRPYSLKWFLPFKK